MVSRNTEELLRSSQIVTEEGPLIQLQQIEQEMQKRDESILFKDRLRHNFITRCNDILNGKKYAALPNFQKIRAELEGHKAWLVQLEKEQINHSSFVEQVQLRYELVKEQSDHLVKQLKIVDGFETEKRLFDRLQLKVRDSGIEENHPAICVSLEIQAHFKLGTEDDLAEIKKKRAELGKLVRKLGKMDEVVDSTVIPGNRGRQKTMIIKRSDKML